MQKIVNQNQTLDFPVYGGKSEPSIFLTTKIVCKIDPLQPTCKEGRDICEDLTSSTTWPKRQDYVRQFLFYF